MHAQNSVAIRSEVMYFNAGLSALKRSLREIEPKRHGRYPAGHLWPLD
jgi:hypothetical protein